MTRSEQIRLLSIITRKYEQAPYHLKPCIALYLRKHAYPVNAHKL